MLEIAFNSDAEIHGTLFMDRDRVAARTRLIPSTIAVTNKSRPERARVESFIQSVYGRTYGAVIGQHYPTLVNVHDGIGNVTAAIGLRRAGDEPLFIENYLARPIEEHIATATGIPTGRDRIVEIGNLASSGHGAAVFLFVTLAAYLNRQDIAYAVVTATKSLRRSFALFGFDVVALADADPSRLPDRGASWGDYYRNEPQVVFGAVGPAFARLEPYLPIAENGDLDRLFSVKPHAAALQ